MFQKKNNDAPRFRFFQDSSIERQMLFFPHSKYNVHFAILQYIILHQQAGYYILSHLQPAQCTHVWKYCIQFTMDLEFSHTLFDYDLLFDALRVNIELRQRTREL